jgi:hypothetical protein
MKTRKLAESKRVSFDHAEYSSIPQGAREKRKNFRERIDLLSR